MNYYRYEKSQLKSLGTWICTIAFLFCFLLNVGANTEAASDNLPEPVEFSLLLYFIGLSICLALTNNALFFSHEQGKRIFILQKYRFFPADLRKMFLTKALLLLRELLICLVLSLAIYLFIIFGKYGTAAELKEPLGLFLMAGIFGLGFSAVSLILDAVLLWRSKS